MRLIPSAVGLWMGARGRQRVRRERAAASTTAAPSNTVPPCTKRWPMRSMRNGFRVDEWGMTSVKPRPVHVCGDSEGGAMRIYRVTLYVFTNSFIYLYVYLFMYLKVKFD